jgi:hypothetical protein
MSHKDVTKGGTERSSDSAMPISGDPRIALGLRALRRRRPRSRTARMGNARSEVSLWLCRYLGRVGGREPEQYIRPPTGELLLLEQLCYFDALLSGKPCACTAEDNDF